MRISIDLRRLDALVNNAAVAIPPGTLAEQMSLCFATNATGPHLMGLAFAPLLKKSITTPRIVNVSSGAGSMSRKLDPTSPMYRESHIQYRASKSALSMVTACQAVEYGDQGFKVFAYCPGFTVSNLSERNTLEAGAKPTSEGTTPMVKILEGERDAEHAGFLTVDGQYGW